MGTSISNRSPDTALWRAVQAAYAQGLPDDRVALEIARASRDWQEALTSSSVSEFVVALVEAFGTLERQLRAASSASDVVREAVEDARSRALLAGGDISALAIAERAFQRVIVMRARGERPLIDSTPDEAADAWKTKRGPAPHVLVQSFAETLLSQFAEHVVSRDISGLVGLETIPAAQAATEYTDRIALRFASRAAAVLAHPSAAHEAWRTAIHRAFASGSEATPDG
jgi:hypothetical protein